MLAQEPKDIIGNVMPPDFLSGGYGGYQQGLIPFISNIIKLLTIVAGLWALVNFVMAGLAYISSEGDPKKLEYAWGKIWMSLLGLIIIAVAFAITGLLSYLLFGDAKVILEPKLYGPG